MVELAFGVFLLANIVFITHHALMMHSIRYRRRLRPNHCPNCYGPYSDWFVWPPGGRYCYPCHTGLGVRVDQGLWGRDPEALPEYFAYGEHPDEIEYVR